MREASQALGVYNRIWSRKMASLLPLFPLDVALLPGAPLPLHIFEPRYREMIAECLERNQNFGVLRAKEENIAEVGCTAEIIAVTKKYPDGKMDIVTQGRERFEVLRLSQERAFLQAEVMFIHDEGERASEDEIKQAVGLHGEIMKLAGAQPANVAEIEPSQLAFFLAGSLPLDLDFKQNLLTMRSESERVRSLISYLQSILPNLRRSVHVRQKAGGNGHAH